MIKRRILGVVVLLEGLSSSESGYLSLICNDLLAKAIAPVLASKATGGSTSIDEGRDILSKKRT